MSDTYSCSYVEVLEILKHIPKKEYEKIPKEKIEFYEKNKDKNYIYIYDPIEVKTLRKTDSILINLYRNYIAKEDKKKKINEILRQNEIKGEQEKQKTFNQSNIFKSKNKSYENNNKVSLKKLEIKESFFHKFVSKIKRIFHINS